MVPVPSRRQLLATTGSLATVTDRGRVLAATDQQSADGTDDWSTAQHDPVNRGYPRGASPPTDGMAAVGLASRYRPHQDDDHTHTHEHEHDHAHHD